MPVKPDGEQVGQIVRIPAEDGGCVGFFQEGIAFNDDFGRQNDGIRAALFLQGFRLGAHTSTQIPSLDSF